MSTWHRRRRRVAPLSLTVAAVALAAGCASDPAHSAAPATASPGLPAPSASPVSPARGNAGGTGDPAGTKNTAATGDPSTWTLPLQAYQPTEQQAAAIATAEATLVQRCMRSFGKDWRPAPALPRIGPRNMMDWRYGIHDEVLSSWRGYQPDAAEQARYDAAVRAQSERPAPSPDEELLLGGSDLPDSARQQAGPEARSGTIDGRKIPAGGCFGQARTTLGSQSRGVSPLVERLNFASYEASLRDPAVIEVFGLWSACMREKHYSYAAPLDADQDPRFRPDPRRRVSALEIATAVADISCRRRHRVAETWHGVEVRIQDRYIRENAARLTADRRTLDAVIRNSATVGGGS
ncbi:hypothetical protein [Streptomyces sp. NPDC002825]|uniref:hypothetical protein n=1 Tax=Streptomyces sp. NPDC002825 TaxID=3154666 RepID=UPI0033313812